MRLTQIIEALLFASDAPLTAADLARVDERLDEDTVEAVIQELRSEYEQTERSFQIYEVAGGYQLLTRPDFVSVLERYDSVPQPARLSTPALEVLAIIAYRQPIGRVEIEEIRGVGSSGVLRTLSERHLVEPVARGEGLGRPLLYGTTSKFLEHFGFRSLEDLPRPDELPIVLRERTAPSQEGVASEEAGIEGAPADAVAAEGAAAEGVSGEGAAAEGAAAEGVSGESAAAEGAAMSAGEATEPGEVTAVIEATAAVDTSEPDAAEPEPGHALRDRAPAAESEPAAASAGADRETEAEAAAELTDGTRQP
jgi:segregation and condensation protein B